MSWARFLSHCALTYICLGYRGLQRCRRGQSHRIVEAGSPHRGALVKQEVNRFCNNPLTILFESVKFDLTKCDPWSVVNPRFLETLSLPTHNLSTPSQGDPILSIGESILDSKPSLSGKPVSPRPWHHLQKWKPRGNSNRTDGPLSGASGGQEEAIPRSPTGVSLALEGKPIPQHHGTWAFPSTAPWRTHERSHPSPYWPSLSQHS